MPEGRYPTIDEYWTRLKSRELEADLRDELQARLRRETEPVSRVGRPETVVAVAHRLLPDTGVPPEALAAFVDAVYDKQQGRGDERLGAAPRERLIPMGFEVLDAVAPRPFESLPPEAQDELLSRAESGELSNGDGFDSALWFGRLRDLVLLGFGSDPRGMVHMGFPGPSYKSGYLWLDEWEVAKREERAPGHQTF